jgi:hypothetical protein
VERTLLSAAFDFDLDRRFGETNAKIRGKNKIKDSGQECPLHRGFASNWPSTGFFADLSIGSAH